MNRKYYILLVILIFIFAIAIRVWNFGYLKDINCDEAMTAINAKSIAENGTDIFNTSYPVYFESWRISGQSAFPTYIVALFIKLFGFEIFFIRLPMLLISISSLFFMFLFVRKICKNRIIPVVILLLLTINPWDIMQSNWFLDCNFFPHMLLISIYLLYVGIENKKNIVLYLSMIFFSLTLYTYGISLYLIPIFLIAVAIYCIKEKKVKIHTLIICILIFVIISLPIILMVIINLFNLPTINIGKITIQNFEYSTRKSDMLIFSNNIIITLFENIKSTLEIFVGQTDRNIWNSFEGFGTLYFISLPFIIFGLVIIFYYLKGRKECDYNKFGIILLKLWFIISLLCGILINDVNINRVNIIWYILLIFNAIGIYEFIRLSKHKKIYMSIIIIIYSIYFGVFMQYYHIVGINKIESSETWSQGLVESLEYAANNNNEIILSIDDINDKKGIFILYAINFFINEKTIDYYNIKENDILTKRLYIIDENYYDNIENIGEYKIKKFNHYLVLIKE